MKTQISWLPLLSVLLPISLGASAQGAAPMTAWGSNTFGQSTVPPGMFVAIAAGGSHSLAIRSDGTLVGFGLNENGQTNVPAGTFTAVAASLYHSLGIRSDSTLAGWGYGGDGQLNLPSGTFTAIAAGYFHSVAIRSDGTLVAWGDNGAGQLNVPLGTFIAISSKYTHTLAIRSDGTLAAWGCGATDFGHCDVPAGTFIEVAAGQFHSLAIRSDGTLAAWGRNVEGQTNVPNGTFTTVAAGGYYGLAIRSDGTLVGWGNNAAGQTDVPNGKFTAIAAGGGQSLGLYSTTIPTISEWGLIALTLLVLSAGTMVLGRRRGFVVQPASAAIIATTSVVLVTSAPLRAQPAPSPSETIPLTVDSELVSATQGTEPVVIFSHKVQVEDAAWIRLHFGKVELSGSQSAGNESFLRITSKADGDIQELNSLALARWRNSTAYFNGDTVLVELLARAGTGENRLVIDHAVAGTFSELESSLYICGTTDDRVPSSDPRTARIFPVICTGFLFNERSNCLLTAGHCAAGMLGDEGTVVQFNVPLSSCNGTVNHPAAQYQYPLDPASNQYNWTNDVAEDWYLFGVFDNTTTGFSPLKAQGASYKLATSVPTADDSDLQVTGYGLDFDPAGTCSPYATNQYSKTQQTDIGPYDGKVGTEVRYILDIQPGSSGGAVEHVTSELVYAICSGAFCDSSGGYNSGTAVDLQDLQDAIACPVGICADCNGNEILDQCDLNCSSSCGGCNVTGCGESDDCNSNGVPDECDIAHGTDPDCNDNDVPDECDITSEESEDCDENEVPDECQELGSCCLPSVSCDECMTEEACDLIYGNWGPSGNCIICAMSP